MANSIVNVMGDSLWIIWQSILITAAYIEWICLLIYSRCIHLYILLQLWASLLLICHWPVALKGKGSRKKNKKTSRVLMAIAWKKELLVVRFRSSAHLIDCWGEVYKRSITPSMCVIPSNKFCISFTHIQRGVEGTGMNTPPRRKKYATENIYKDVSNEHLWMRCIQIKTPLKLVNNNNKLKIINA